jgi:hypothetical protein
MAVILAKPTMFSFKTSKYMGSKTLMLYFFKACCTEVYVRYVWTSSSQTWRAALLWAAVPSVLAGAHPGACGLIQSVGPESVVGEIIA